MNRLLITLREISWLSVLAVVAIVVSISTAIIFPSLAGLAVVIGLSGVTLSVLSQKE